MSIELELIEQDELLDGLMALTGYNLGLSHQLLDKVIKKTEYEVQTTLKEIANNIDREKRNARRRALYALNKNMRLSSNHPPKPKNTASHHIVALTDPRAERALRILLRWSIDFNDEANGVNLPRYKKYVPHNSMSDAIAHSQIHTENYHENVAFLLTEANSMATSKNDIIEVLREIAADLQLGVFPINERIG